MKKFFLFSIAILAAVTLKAQGGYNYYEWGWGVDASYIKGFTNVTPESSHIALNANLIYNFNPYLPVAAEFQAGKLSGGGAYLDQYGRQYTNNYKAVLLHADFQLGAAIDYQDNGFLNVIKNFYVGTGFGFILNNNTVIRHPYYQPSYTFPGSDSNIDLMIPLRLGYEFKIFDSYEEPAMAIDIGYIHNITFGEGLDGYNDPSSKFKNNSLDQYRQIVIGFKYFFGNTVSYNKIIRTFN